MFQLSRNTEYSLMSLKALAEEKNKDLLSAREIADQLKIPYDNVAKALQKFAKINVVEVTHGVSGGYKIKANLEQVSLYDILEAIEGAPALVRCQGETHVCDLKKSCNVQSPLSKINLLFTDILKKQSLKDFFQFEAV